MTESRNTISLGITIGSEAVYGTTTSGGIARHIGASRLRKHAGSPSLGSERIA